VIAAPSELRIGVAGRGAIGSAVIERLLQGVERARLTAIGVRSISGQPPSTVPLLLSGTLGEICDIVIDCGPGSALDAIARPALERGRTVITLNAAALLKAGHLFQLATDHGGRLYIPSGSIAGIDGLKAAAQGHIHSVTLITRKPPRALAKAPAMAGVDPDRLVEPLRLFSGSVRDGALAFPANVNVAAVVALAGIGPDRTKLEVWADPSVERNTHILAIDSDSARMKVVMENIPTVENPATGRSAAQSIVALLRDLAVPFRVGG
jgi:aspartate dehydrogenase